MSDRAREGLVPVDFTEANRVGHYGDLEAVPLWREGEALISCWRAGWRDRLRILLTGRIWLQAVGAKHPVVALYTVYPWALGPPEKQEDA